MRRTLRHALVSAATLLACSVAFGQVAGDECSMAIAVSAGVPIGFSTVQMTPSANPPANGPCPYLAWGNSRDIWFKFTPPSTGTVTIRLCESTYDTSVVVYSGECSSLVRLDCDDDSCNPDSGFQSIIESLGVLSGSVYFIRVGGWNGEAGSGTVLVNFTAIGGGCQGATGACNQPHPTPGCADPGCCAQVCSIDPTCCNLAWDLDCVSAAVRLCGRFFYTCNPGAPPNDCATAATPILASGTFPFSSVGASTDGPNHPGSACGSLTEALHNDLWWKFEAGTSGMCTVSTCGTTPYDNKLAVYAYETGTDPDFNTLDSALVACNDDGAEGQCLLSDGATPFASALSFSAFAGKTYFVRMGSYSAGQTGNGSITFTLPQPCALPASNGIENEACGASGNGGCDDPSGGSPVQPITLGAKIAGSYWAVGGTRDTDWYGLSLAADTRVTIKLSSGSFSTLLLLGGTCGSVVTLGTGSGNCPNEISACLNAGQYRIFVAPQSFEGLACGVGVGTDYVLEVTGIPAACPVATDICDDPGPDTVTQSKDPTLAVGGVGCAAGGNSTANSYARSFTGLGEGEIRCVEFGYSNSGGPVPASLVLCRDIDGGAPRRIGVDLIELARRDLLPLASFGLVTAEFDEPVCLDGNTHPITVILEIGASSGGFATYAGNTDGATAPTYIRSEACGLFTFTDVTAIGYSELQWVVSINGDFANCETAGPPGDLNGDGIVNAADLAILLGQWGGTGSADLSGDGIVDAADLAILLGGWV